MNIRSIEVRSKVRQALKEIKRTNIVTESDIDKVIKIFENELEGKKKDESQRT